jgi:DNA modification methylase
MYMEKIKLTLILGDCLKVLPTIPSESVDLIITSPPYNVGKDYQKYSCDDLPKEEYQKLLETVIKESYRILKIGGRLAINVPNAIMSKKEMIFLSPLVHNICFENKFIPREFIIWDKGIIPAYGTAWGSYKSPSCPYLRNCSEAILVYSKVDMKLHHKGQTDLREDEWLKWTRDIWHFNPTKINGHPTPFPEELPKRLIKLYSFIGDTILDPFLGSGTTMKVARDLKRSCIGIEINPKYIEITKKRLNWGSSLSDKIEWEFKDMSDLK